MSRQVYVPLPESAVEALVRVARDERRRPRDQAAVFILEALRRRAEDEAHKTTDERRP